jgi:glucose-6-phosphate 1-dehydrogenase
VSAQEPPANPLTVGLERLPVHPTTLVIFGGTGDLSKRKLLPALYNLAHEGALPERFELVGVSRSELPDAEWEALITEAVREHSRREPDEQVLARLVEGARYVSGSFDDPGMFERLGEALATYDRDAGQRLNRCFYLSTAPDFFPVIVEGLQAAGLNDSPDAEVRVVIEKPFGTTLAEAQELNTRVLQAFSESQVFRIDHYLGKETVQNVLALRFANSLFEPIWNRNAIRNVQITAAEDLGIGSRAGYYDGAGALRDLVQNHMLQLLCLLCMEPPVDFTADAVRDEKVKVLKAIKPPPPERTVRARYAAGTVGGDAVPGYLEEEGVPADSQTETYAALRLTVQNWRWAGVPIYLRTGKRLARKVTEIAVTLRDVPHPIFKQEGSVGVQPNQIVLTVQPNEGVTIKLNAKIPGGGGASQMRIRPVGMEFLYGTSFMSQSPEAYERLIMDAMRGDATLFTRNDEVEAQWRIIDPVLDAWAADAVPLAEYEAGTAGPDAAASILAGDDRWRAV